VNRPEVFPIAGRRLDELFPGLRCDRCGRRAADAPEEIWAKAGCAYFCGECVAAGRHLMHPAASRCS
jgi:hypothetical protein